MPKIINHDQRRREVANAVLRVVLRSGLNGVTMREVAAESNWSTGALSHYFDGKRHLLHEALIEAARQAGHNLVAASRSKRSSLTKLRALLEELLPLDERREALSNVFCYFYGDAAAGGETAKELSSYYSVWRRLVEQAIVSGQRDGSVRADLDPKLLAEILVCVVDGLGLEASLDKSTLPPRRQRQVVSALVRFIAAGNDQIRSSGDGKVHRRRSGSGAMPGVPEIR